MNKDYAKLFGIFAIIIILLFINFYLMDVFVKNNQSDITPRKMENVDTICENTEDVSIVSMCELLDHTVETRDIDASLFLIEYINDISKPYP